MKKEATIKDYVRLCKAFRNKCDICPMGIGNNGESEICPKLITRYPDKANEIILKWCEEHPIKTRQGELLKAFPNANVPIDFETINICPLDFDKRFDDEMCHSYEDCTACKKEYWLAEVDE